MRQINLTETARDDLKDIWEYVAQNNVEAAGRLIREIVNQFARLRDHPHSGRQRDYLLLNLRSFPIKNYLIFYQPFADRIEILRILHNSRDIESAFEKFFESL